VFRGGGASAQGADARYGLSYGADGEQRFGDRRSVQTTFTPSTGCNIVLGAAPASDLSQHWPGLVSATKQAVHGSPACLCQTSSTLISSIRAVRSEAAEATKRRLEAAAAAKEAEDREAATQRASRRAPHKVGGLSAEEKAARLAEMQQNAEAHDRDRGERLQRAEDRDAAEDGEAACRARDS